MKLSPFWHSWSIAKLTSLMVFAPILCLSLVLSYFYLDRQLMLVHQTLEIQGAIITEKLANDSEHFMFTANLDMLQQLVDNVASREDVDSAVIGDLGKHIIVSAGNPVVDIDSTDSFSITTPIVYQDVYVDKINQEIDPLNVTVGWANVRMSGHAYEKRQQAIVADSIVILILALLISIFIAYYISRSLFAPLKKFHSAVEDICAGNFSENISIEQGGEFADLENGLNKVASELQLSKEQQKQRVDDATQALMDIVLQLEQKNVLLDEARKEAEEIGNSKVEFLANMSHEIRTPLNAVIGASDLLMKMIQDSNAEKYLTTLSVASRQLNSVVDDILDFSRMEANKLELEHTAFNVVEVLDNVISLYSPLAHDKGLDLVLQVESGMPDSIFGDAMRLTQVVSNLVSNAIKFTEKGQVVVSASAVIVNNINLRLQIKVKDTGAGLTESAQENLFDAFSQADSAVARKYGGSGLGLAIVRKLVEQMQGFINVKSNVGEGTEFNVHLDLKLDRLKTDDHENKLAGLSAILYEKDHVAEETIKNILIYWGVGVTVCTDDDEFISLLTKYKSESKSYDCIITGMEKDILATDSVESCVRKIRHLSTSPVILMLNSAKFELPSHIIDEKSCWLTRPVNRQLLYAKLKKIHDKEFSIADQSSADHDDGIDTSDLLKDLKILIAEDNEFNRDLLTEMLRAYGADVQSVVDGQYAVDAAGNGDFDIIFLDLHMPRKDGITAANEIKLLVLDKSPFLIAATADVFIKDQGEEVDVFDSFVFKPIREEVLLEKLTLLLNFQGDYQNVKNNADSKDNAFTEKLDREVRKLVLHIVEASNSDDYPEIENFAHQLRGVCGFYEMDEMTVAVTHLEGAAKEKRRDDIVLHIKELLKMLNISPDFKTIN